MELRPISRTTAEARLSRASVEVVTKEIRDLHFEVVEGSNLTAEIDGQTLPLSTIARDQMLSAARIPKSFFTNSSPEFQQEILSRKLFDDSKVRLSTVMEDGTRKVRGIYPEAHHIHTDLEVLNFFPESMPIVTISGGTANSSHTMFRAVLPDMLKVEGEELYLGIQVNNSEIGASPLTMDAILFRPVCTNGAIFVQEKAQFFNSKFGELSSDHRNAVINMLVESIAGRMEYASSRVIEAQKTTFTPDQLRGFFDNIVKNPQLRPGISKQFVLERAREMEEQANLVTDLWSVVNSFTFSAQAVELLPKRNKIERIAADFMGLSMAA